MSVLRRSLLVILLLAWCGQARAQRAGTGLFGGTGICSDVTGQVASSTFCMDFSAGGLWVWNGAAWVQIAGNAAQFGHFVTLQVDSSIGVGQAPGSDPIDITDSGNGAARIVISNPNGGTAAQAGYFVGNVFGVGGGFSQTGNGSTFAAPYAPDEVYVNSAGSNGLLLYAYNGTGVIKFAANGGASTLNLNEDGGGNFGFTPSGGGYTQINGPNPALIVQSSTNTSADILQVYPQNRTQGIAMSWNYIHSIGTGPDVSMDISTKGVGTLDFNPANATSQTRSFSNFYVVNNHHLQSTVDGGPGPSLGACGAGSPSLTAGSTDTAGSVSIGGVANSCIVLFGRGFGLTPTCLCTVGSPAAAGIVLCGADPTQTSTSQVRFLFQTAPGTGQPVYYHCIGRG